MYTIIGKGFGLYGYLPAIIISKSKLILPKNYKSHIELRSDIKNFVDKIIWSDDCYESISKAKKIVIAISPRKQHYFIKNNKNHLKNKILFLEKPISNDPYNSESLINLLIEENITFYVNYSFIYLDWYKRLKKKILYLSNKDKIIITWRFRAYHISKNIHNWKSNKQLGGGILRFYGIHILAILVALNYENLYINGIELSDKKIHYSFIDSDKSTIELLIDIDSPINNFNITLYNRLNEQTLIDIYDPFCENKPERNELDRRVNVLQKHLFKKNEKLKSISFNKKVIKLWKKIEAVGI